MRRLFYFWIISRLHDSLFHFLVFRTRAATARHVGLHQSDTNQTTSLLENLAIADGFLALYAAPASRYSLDARFARRNNEGANAGSPCAPHTNAATPTTARWIPGTAFRSPTTTIRATSTAARCGSSTRTACSPASASASAATMNYGARVSTKGWPVQLLLDRILMPRDRRNLRTKLGPTCPTAERAPRRAPI